MAVATETPRLSPSIAKHVLSCPIRAYQQHRLLGGQESATTDAMLTGQILERMITGHGVDEIAIVDAADYRTKAAQTERNEAFANGLIPMLACKYEAVSETGRIIADKMAARIPHWADMLDQVKLTWTADGECSGVLDRLYLGESSYLIVDLKSISNADPDTIERSFTKYGYDIQHAAYVEAVETVYPHLAGRGEMLFAFYETSDPYCVTIAKPSGEMAQLGAYKWKRAKEIWSECMETGVWPEYQRADELFSIECKPWDWTILEEGI